MSTFIDGNLDTLLAATALVTAIAVINQFSSSVHKGWRRKA